MVNTTVLYISNEDCYYMTNEGLNKMSLNDCASANTSGLYYKNKTVKYPTTEEELKEFAPGLYYDTERSDWFDKFGRPVNGWLINKVAVNKILNIESKKDDE